AFAPQPGTWREYGLITRVMIANARGKTQAWIPVPSVDTGWFKSGESTWMTNARSAAEVRDPKYGTRVGHVEWSDGETTPAIDVISRVATQDRAVNLSKPGSAAALSDQERHLYTAATTLIQTDGIVKEYSDRITAGAKTDLEKARRIYDWIVENTF